MTKITSQTQLKVPRGRWSSELELAQAAAAMDSQARYDLVDMLCNRVYSISSCLSGKHMQTEDLAQSALIEILLSAGSFRGESSLSRWADRIVVLTSMKQIRKHQRRRRLWEERPEAEESSYSEPPLPDTVSDSKTFWTHFQQIIQTLSPERRTVFVLHHIQEYNISEVASITRTPVNTVKDRLKYARKKLRKKMLSDPVLREWVKERMP